MKKLFLYTITSNSPLWLRFVVWLLRLFVCLCVVIGPFNHLSVWAGLYGGFNVFFADYLKNPIFATSVYLIIVFGPYLVVGLAGFLANTIPSLLVCLVGTYTMLHISYNHLTSASVSTEWAVVLQFVLLYPLATVVSIITLVVRRKTQINHPDLIPMGRKNHPPLEPVHDPINIAKSLGEEELPKRYRARGL